MMAPVEVSGGQQEEALGIAVGEVQQSGGLLPPLAVNRQGGCDRGGSRSGEVGSGQSTAQTETLLVAAGHRA